MSYPPPCYFYVIFSGLLGLGLSAAAQAAPGDVPEVAQVEDTPPEAQTAQTSTENTPVLGEVKVTAQALPDGDAEAGYRVEAAKQVGIWGELSQQNTPYSMTIVTDELMKNQGVGNNTQQIIRMIPGAYDGFTRSNYGIVDFSLRGFGTQQLLDGIRLSGDNRGINFDDVERIEVMPGFTGFFYGAGYAGGAVNYVLKRPTREPYNNVTVGNAGGAQYYTHGDFGGPVPGTDGRFGYRINLIYLDGESSRDYVFYRQTGISAALDWHLTDKLLLQFDASQKSWRQTGDPGGSDWADSGRLLPDPPKASRAFGQKWAIIDNRIERYGTNLTWEANDWLNVRAAWRWDRVKNKYVNGAGPHFPGEVTAVYASKQDGSRNEQYGGNVYADFKFDTWRLRHKLTTGYSLAVTEPYSLENYLEMAYYGDATWDNPYLPKPAWHSDAWRSSLLYGPMGGRYYKTGHNEFENFVIGDQIDLGERFTLLVGATHARIHTQNYNLAGETTSEYNRAKWTPNVSLLYKPVQWATFYGTWIQALENGQIVPEQDGDGWRFRNAFEILLPTTSEQYELGVKATLNERLLLTGALFWIDKANYFTEHFPADQTLKMTQDGRQINKGVELGISGKVTDRLALWGGITWLDAKITKTNNELQKNQTPANLPEFQAKLYAEYRLPLWDNGIYVTGGAYHTGKQRYSESRGNTRMQDAYTVYDLGARYETRIKGIPTAFRFNVQNVTDHRYWTRATSGHLGDPRTVTFSVSTQF